VVLAGRLIVFVVSVPSADSNAFDLMVWLSKPDLDHIHDHTHAY
jgi:hypothetical protein